MSAPKLTIPLRSVLSDEFAAALAALMAQPLSMPASFNLALAAKEIEAQRAAYQEARLKRIKELGEQKPGTEIWEVTDPEKKETLVRELTELVDSTQIVLPIRKKIDASSATLAAGHVLRLLELIENPNPEEAE